MKMNKRFEYREHSQCIMDNLTGFVYDGNRETCNLLNQLSDKNDRLVEEFTDEGQIKLWWEIDIRRNFDEEIMKLFRKYDIDNIRKLNQILFNQKVW